VGEVDELENPVDERVAERDQRVNRPVREADQEDVDEFGRVLDQIDPEPNRNENDEDEAEDRENARARPVQKPGDR
jgi:hypothetical protein